MSGFWSNCMDTSFGWRKQVIRFWWPWLVFKVAGDLRMSHFDQKMLVRTLSHKPMDGFRPNLVDCIIGMGKTLDQSLMIKLISGFWPNLQRYIIDKVVSCDKILVTLTQLSRSHALRMSYFDQNSLPALSLESMTALRPNLVLCKN